MTETAVLPALIRDEPDWLCPSSGACYRLRVWRLTSSQLLAMLSGDSLGIGNEIGLIMDQLAFDHPIDTIVLVEHRTAQPDLGAPEEFATAVTLGLSGRPFWRKVLRDWLELKLGMDFLGTD